MHGDARAGNGHVGASRDSDRFIDPDGGGLEHGDAGGGQQHANTWIGHEHRDEHECRHAESVSNSHPNAGRTGRRPGRGSGGSTGDEHTTADAHAAAPYADADPGAVAHSKRHPLSDRNPRPFRRARPNHFRWSAGNVLRHAHWSRTADLHDAGAVLSD